MAIRRMDGAHFDRLGVKEQPALLFFSAGGESAVMHFDRNPLPEKWVSRSISCDGNKTPHGFPVDGKALFHGNGDPV